MSLGILGGTFNPIHLAHLRLGEELREALGLERVFFVPAAQPPLKRRGVAPARDRLAMVELAVAQNPAFGVLTLEIERRGPSYTVDTLRSLRSSHPDQRLWFLVGSDVLGDLDQWREPDALLELASLAVAPRGGAPSGAREVRALLPPALAAGLRDGPQGLLHPSGNELRVIPFTPLGISASDIRRRIARGASVRYLIPDAVADYIRKHSLYQEDV